MAEVCYNTGARETNNIKETSMLKFSPANNKIHALSKVRALKPYLADKRKIFSLDLLSGWACPYADECLSKAVVDKATGKRHIKDGPNTQFRCFSASQEVLFTGVYNLRKHNYDLLKACPDVRTTSNLIADSLPKKTGIVRIHVGGDFFNQDYFDAWIWVAKAYPEILFYAYTKSLPYWVARLNDIPPNLVLTASYGGRRDDMIVDHELRHVKVVHTVKQAKAMGLAIDHDDSHAANPKVADKNFALLIHGVQPAGSESSKAVKALKGKGSYGTRK